MAIRKILVFNPNTSTSTTSTFIPILSKLHRPDTSLTYWTCPTGPAIIKTHQDMLDSTAHCIPLLLAIADGYDGFLGACFADHPVVKLLRSCVRGKPVVGIFEASVRAATHFCAGHGPFSRFGIVTTGKPFENLLSEGVEQLVCYPKGAKQPQRFSGVAASGIGLGDLHPDAKEAARAKVISATRRMLRSGDVDVLCVGGVILAGMERWIREGCEIELGREMGRKVVIIDQLLAGFVVLDAMLSEENVIDFSPVSCC